MRSYRESLRLLQELITSLRQSSNVETFGKSDSNLIQVLLFSQLQRLITLECCEANTHKKILKKRKRQKTSRTYQAKNNVIFPFPDSNFR